MSFAYPVTVEPDPFEGRYSKWIHTAFLFLKPSFTKPEFVLLQMLYETSPHLVSVLSPLHSNDATDVLHFSVLVKTPFRSATIHINGYWKNDFKIMNVTMMTSDNISGKVECGIIASFIPKA